MLWPYIFLTFVFLILFKAGHPFAAIVAATVTVGFFIIDFYRTPRRFIPVILAGVVLGIFLFFLRISHLNTDSKISLQGEAEVTGVSRKSVTVTTAEKQNLRLTGLKKEQLPQKHALIRYRCEVQEVPESTFMVFERLSGVSAWCRVKELNTLKIPSGFLVNFRQRTLEFLYTKFESIKDRSLIAAFVLGDTDDLAAQELDAFRDMGLMHLFAVSGLNIALLFAILYLPFRFVGLPQIGSILGYTVATAFLLLLDFPVPLMRAWLFMTIGLGMRVIDRRLPSWTLLFLTAIIVELLFPLSTFSMSFVLSFGVTAAILLFYEPLHFCFAVKNRLGNLLSEHVALTLSAGLPALIMGFALFGTAQPLSLLYNLLLVPFSGLYLFISLIFLIFEPAKHMLSILDTLYFKFASWHASYVMNYFPVAESYSQIVSLILIVFLLIALYGLSRTGWLWSARRNLRLIIPCSAIVLILPYFLVTYPTHAIYAIPNKVWIYDERRITTAGSSIFSENTHNSPRYCFPVRTETLRTATITQNTPDIIHVADECFIFSGRMKPEAWPSDALKKCRTINLYTSKKCMQLLKSGSSYFPCLVSQAKLPYGGILFGIQIALQRPRVENRKCCESWFVGHAKARPTDF